MNLEDICNDIFGEHYNIGPDGPDRAVINCTIPWETLQQISPARNNLPESQDLTCGLKLCNIQGCIVVIYPGEQEGTFSYFIVNIAGIPNPNIKKQWRKLYIAWAQRFKHNIEFDLNAIRRRQREAARLAADQQQAEEPEEPEVEEPEEPNETN